MPSAFWSKPANKLKKCSERRIPTCDQDATDDCCEVVACTYCLIWETYGENPEYGTATFTGNSWEGSVGSISFRAFWERGYQSGECEFVVEANGEEVYRKSCYEGQSCRDSSDEASVSIPYAEGTLGWSKDLKRPLPHVTDYGTTCKRRWCGDCECTCKCLCITVVDPNGVVTQGEICDANYDCDGPVWAGTVGGVYISASLEADEYTGECYLAIDADYEEFDQDVTDCNAISFSIELYDGTIVSGSCKQCSCAEQGNYLCECRFDLSFSVVGTLKSAGTVCTINPFAVTTPQSGQPATVAPENRAWLPEWCMINFVATYKITAFPPNCIDPVTGNLVVIVKKTTEDDAPLINNSIVQLEDWYAVVYTADGSTLLGIFYEYSQCCLDARPDTAASSKLIRVRLFDVEVGGDTWDIAVTNTATLAMYGDCS